MKTIKKSVSKTNIKNNKNPIQKITNNLSDKKSDKSIFPTFKDNLEKNNTNKKLFTSVRKYKIYLNSIIYI